MMEDKETIDLLEKQIRILEQAGIDISGDRNFFYVREYDIALEGVYVTHKKHPGILDGREVKSLVDDFGMDTSEFGR